MDEFSIIREYFSRQVVHRDDVIVGVGDDAAIVTAPPDLDLVCTTDMLLEGIHFPDSTEAYAVGYKALAVNLSDLAAMGARPAWTTLLLSMPTADLGWIKGFSAGFFALAAEYHVQLIGGDLSRGPLVVGVQALGHAARHQVMLRSAAAVGDAIFVSGQLGDAAMGLRAVQGRMRLPAEVRDRVVHRLAYPQPRVDLGLAIAGIAHAAIDVSDGLFSDLGHIAASSGVTARIGLDLIPISSDFREYGAELGWQTALCSGDDYELCFTAAEKHTAQIIEIGQELNVPLSKIGWIEKGQGVKAVAADGTEFVPQHQGHNHFAA